MAGAGVLCVILVLFFSLAHSHFCDATSCYCDALGQAEYDYHVACPSLSNKTLDIEVRIGDFKYQMQSM